MSTAATLRLLHLLTPCTALHEHITSKLKPLKARTTGPQAIRALRFCGGDLSAAASFAADERARQQARRAQRQKDAELRKEQKLCARFR